MKRIPDQPASGTPDRSPASDQQTNVPHGDERPGNPRRLQRSSSLGGGLEPADWNLALDRDIPVLTRGLEDTAGNARINLVDMNHTHGDDLRLEDDNGEPFTGEAAEEAAGILLAQEFYSNGVPHGPSRERWDNGTRRSEGENYHGKPRGIFKRWHRNGRLVRENIFSDEGLLINRREWDEEGRPI